MNDITKDDQAAAIEGERAVEVKHDTSTVARPRSAWSGVLLVITLAIASGSLYLAWQNRSDGLSAHGIVKNLHETVAALTARVAVLEAQLEQVRESGAATSRLAQDLASAMPGSNEDWALLEIEFLLIIANHHLELERNIDAALAAMQAADLRLRGLGGTALDSIRAQLAGDIKNLQQLNTVDIGGLAQLLGDLAGRINDLPLAGATGAYAGQDIKVAQAPAKDTIADQRMLHALWQEMKNLVVIRHETEKPAVLLAPDQQYFIYQNLRLELASARQSLLRRDTRSLHTSVASLQQWLNEYFNTNDPAVVSMMVTMQKLSSIELEPPLPDLNSTLESLRAYMREKDEMPTHSDSMQAPQT